MKYVDQIVVCVDGIMNYNLSMLKITLILSKNCCETC